MKKKPRPKSTPPKAERKPKGAKGRPTPKSSRVGKAAGAKKPASATATRPEPSEHGPAGDPDKSYGGFALKLHDHDQTGETPAVYEGKVRDVIFPPGKPVKSPVATSCATGAAAKTCNVQDGVTQLIANLQRHLWALGFWIFPRTNTDGVVEPVVSGKFDWRTEWAVREFQIAAAMPNVAEQDVNKKPTAEECKSPGKYLSTLSAKKNDNVFPEHPSGVLTPKTTEWIKEWLVKNYRCPVVIQAFRMKPAAGTAPAKKGKKGNTKVKMVRDVVYAENLWCHDEVTTADIKMFAWDFSGHFQFGDHSNKEIPVGTYRPSGKFGGPIADSSDAWPEARLTPKSWRGKDWDEMTKDEKSTWRAIMAVARRECAGSLDVVNFWDNCHGSGGHYHWTMPKVDKGVVSGGEYCGFMAMLEAKYPDAFKLCFADFGLWGPRWVGSSADGAREPVSAGVTFGGYTYTKAVDGKFLQCPEKGCFSEANWLRSWHAAYRLEMAARTCADYRTAMWEYARMRIVGMLKMSQVDAWLPDACRTDGAKVTLGDMFTSQQGMAFVLRLHVWRPASFTHAKRELVEKTNKKTGKKEQTWQGLPILHDALEKLFAEGTLKGADGKPIKDKGGNLLKWESPVLGWKDDHERILIDTMLDFAGQYTKASAKRSLQQARYWPLALPKGSLDLEEKHSDEDKKGGKEPYTPTGPLLHVREPSPGLPTPPKRLDNKGDAIQADLDKYQPSVARGSFRLAD